MDSHKSSEDPKVVIRDLKHLFQLITDGKEGYHHAAETTKTPELHKLFLELEDERKVFATELKEHIAFHGGKPDEGGLIGDLHRSWITIKEAITGKDDVALLEGIVKGEQAAIAKFDECIADYNDHVDHLKLLIKQRDGIKTALNGVEALRTRYWFKSTN